MQSFTIAPLHAACLQILEVGNERFIIPELLFAPAMPVAAFKNEPLINVRKPCQSCFVLTPC